LNGKPEVQSEVPVDVQQTITKAVLENNRKDVRISCRSCILYRRRDMIEAREHTIQSAKDGCIDIMIMGIADFLIGAAIVYVFCGLAL
jgi:hypothetical protein